jgi:hypothetical protein
MSTHINERLRQALLPLVPIVEPDAYGGPDEEYIVFRVSEIPVFFGDNEPEYFRCLISINWYLPRYLTADPLKKKRAIRQALVEAGFTHPTVTPIGDENGPAWCFETEAIDGDI